ncbi:MAG: hypothetical protein HY319_19210 [Armatimonadetes bacterium]|nr:hypothetical protein [Armatimonadota bacterium]
MAEALEAQSRRQEQRERARCRPNLPVAPPPARRLQTRNLALGTVGAFLLLLASQDPTGLCCFAAASIGVPVGAFCMLRRA